MITEERSAMDDEDLTRRVEALESARDQQACRDSATLTDLREVLSKHTRSLGNLEAGLQATNETVVKIARTSDSTRSDVEYVRSAIATAIDLSKVEADPGMRIDGVKTELGRRIHSVDSKLDRVLARLGA